MAALVLCLAAPVAQAAPAADARAFVDTIGVNTHLFYTNTVYANYPMLKQRLQELGVRHLRDGMDPDRRQFFFDRVNDLARAGIKSTMINCTFPNLRDWQHYTEDVKIKVRGAVEAVEGVNEPDLQQGGQHDGGEWWNDARSCGYWTNQLLDRDGWHGGPLDIPVYGPSATGTSFKKLGNLFAIGIDGGNMHPYPGARNASGPDYYPFSRSMGEIREWNFEGREVPVIATETGYHDALNSTSSHRPISQRGEAVYLPRLFLEYHRAGVARTFSYELIDLRPDPERDDLERNFGLFENDWSYKPVATALKNTIDFLDSPSAGPRQPLAYTLESTEDEDGTGPAGAVEDSLFQKADRSWWLALWQDSKVWDIDARQDISNPANNVRVKLPRTMNVVGYRPTKGTGNVGTLKGSGFIASVSDDVLLIKLSG